MKAILITATVLVGAFMAISVTAAAAREIHIFSNAIGESGAGPGQMNLASFSGVFGGAPGSEVALNEQSREIYVADTGNRRIDQFTAQGGFVRAWGDGVLNGEAKSQICTTTCRAGLAGQGPGEFEHPNLVAVDDSSAPADQGYVYVGDDSTLSITKFTADGELVESWGNGGPAGSPNGRLEGLATFAGFALAELEGIAVDEQGDLWIRVADTGGSGRGGVTELLEFEPDGSFLQRLQIPGGNAPIGIAIDSSGDFYIGNALGLAKLAPDGSLLGDVENSAAGSGRLFGVGLDRASGAVFSVLGAAGESGGTEVDEFAPPCTPEQGLCQATEVFGGDDEQPSGRLEDAQGMAASTDGTVFVADAKRGQILRYTTAIVPDVNTGSSTSNGPGTVTVSGAVDPDGVAVSECAFEYGQTEAFGKIAACETESGAPIGSGTEPVAVHAQLTGLESTLNYYRLVAGNAAGRGRGATETIGAKLEEPIVESVSERSATLGTSIDTFGVAGACTFEYVSETTFDSTGFDEAASRPCDPPDLAASSQPQAATATLSGLLPGAAYRFRFVVTAAMYVSQGPISSFYTQTATHFESCANEALRVENGSSNLSDCRAYEKVSPQGESPPYLQTNFIAPLPSSEGFGTITTALAVKAAPGGDSLAYVGAPPGNGQGEGSGSTGAGLGDQYMASRGAGGWNAEDIAPLGASPNSRFEGFSEDLSKGIFSSASGERSLAAGIETNCGLLYSRDTGSGAFDPLFATETSVCHRPVLMGQSADASHLIFESSAAKTEGARKAAGAGHENIYDAFEGGLYLVNVLPSGKADPDATLGSLSTEREIEESFTPAADVEDAVSLNGSRVFWTDLNTGILYVRENDTKEPSAEVGDHCTEPEMACTVQVSAGAATYQTATPDGAYAYYAESGQLWRFDVATQSREALTGPGAGVLGVLGVNRTGEDGSHLYFIAEAALSADKVDNGAGEEEARTGRPNLYLIHDGTTTFVTRLLPSDDAISQDVRRRYLAGDWRALQGNRTAQLSSDGDSLTFMSSKRLTSYDNLNSQGRCRELGASLPGCYEVYVYQASTGRIFCASCNPNGAISERVLPNGGTSGPGTFLTPDFYHVDQVHRFISADGSRVFFQTDESLAPSDVNSAPDVYEWERAGTGSCTGVSPFNGGCVYLLSTGTPGTPAFFVEASASGDDVFFATRARLTPADGDEKIDLYDARVDGGFPAVAKAPDCASAAACRAPVLPPQSIQAPGSESFQASPEMHCRAGSVRKGNRCVKKHAHKHKHKRATKHHKKRAKLNRGAGG